MVDAQEFGFDKSRFPKLTEENFDCIICSEVVRMPQECTGCGSLFCSSCIISWMAKKKECPNRCNPKTDSIKPIGKALLRMYNELDVHCKHYEKCKQVLKLVDLDQHEKTCQLPRCCNFELCGNIMNDEVKRQACSPECALIFKLKNANGDVRLMYSELKEYLAPFSETKSKSVNLSLSKSNEETPMMNNSAISGGVVSFKWDSKFVGTNILLAENGTQAYLKEAGYIFKTVLGDQSFNGGIHYWEIHADPRTENELKIGVSVKKDFEPNTAFCDFDYGFAYYGLGQLRHGSNANGNAFGKKFKKEGVLGVCLDMNKGTLSFALDGVSMGVAFHAEALKKGPIWPAVALLHCAGCKVVSGKSVPQYFLAK